MKKEIVCRTPHSFCAFLNTAHLVFSVARTMIAFGVLCCANIFWVFTFGGGAEPECEHAYIWCAEKCIIVVSHLCCFAFQLADTHGTFFTLVALSSSPPLSPKIERTSAIPAKVT